MVCKRKRENRFCRIAAALICLCLLVCPARALAQGATWNDILQEYPGLPVEELAGDLPAYYLHTWQEAFADLQEQGMEAVRIFDADLQEIPLEGSPICTGQRGCFIFGGYEGGARLFDVVVRGDVLGTGKLNITQLVRLARALTGDAPLEGLYLTAGDINMRGGIDIGDLVTLAGWLAGR